MLEGVVFIGTLKLKNPFGGLVVSVTTKPPSGLLSGCGMENDFDVKFFMFGNFLHDFRHRPTPIIN